MSHLQTTLPKLVAAWFEEVIAAVALAVPNHDINVKSLDSASLANATSSSATRLQDISINPREFTTFKTRRSRASNEPDGLGSAHNPFDSFRAISRLVWAFLRRTGWLLWPRPVRYRIPSEYATGVYMRVLGEPLLLDLEREALTYLSSACEEAAHSGFGPSETGLSGVFAIRYSIATSLAALQ